MTQVAHAELSVSYPDIDWSSLRDVYGWAALQLQGWARGSINIKPNGVTTVALYVSGVLEVWVDGVHYFGGDFYGYGRSAVTLRLSQGTHRIDVRLLRDVRANGGIGQPSMGIKLRLEAKGPLLVPVLPDTDEPHQGILISDIVGGESGPFASPYASATLRNDAYRDLYVYEITANHNQCFTTLLGRTPVKFVPGQTRPVGFEIVCVPPATPRGRPIVFTFRYHIEGDPVPKQTYLTYIPPVRGHHEPQKMTFLHPGGMVSYAVLRPPSPHAHCLESGVNVSAPVLLALHGAGLEADSEQVRHSLDGLPDLCAWTLFPTGVTPWSGDDWHTWGFADVEAAIAAIPAWIEQVDWKGPGVDVDRWLVMGHSNGGQGAWYALTHRPDKIIAAAPLSGYSSIQNYVPCTFWQTTDPGKTAVVQAGMNTYRHELLLENAKGIPILQQHGSDDDNVPPYHSRLLSQLIEEAGAQSEYVEMYGKPHWWDGVMTTDPMKHFLRRHLNNGGPPAIAEVPANMRSFTIVSAGQGDMGPKNGVEILQLTVPGQLGKVHVSFDPLTLACALSTSNMRTVRLPLLFSECSLLVVNSQEISARPTNTFGMTLTNEYGKWRYGASLPPLPERRGRQLGAMDAILRTNGAFYITFHSPAAQQTALQVSRNLCQYYGADTRITDDYEEATRWSGINLISVAIGGDLPAAPDGHKHPIRIFGDRVEVVDIGGALRSYPATEAGLAAIYLRPLPGERLEMVVWGADEESLDIAARLVPIVTGTGVPDFVIADRTMLWKGVEGTLAMGWFDSDWEVSRNSYFT